MDWATLLRRSFALDVLECPKCHDRLRVLAVITERDLSAAHRSASSRTSGCRGPIEDVVKYGNDPRGSVGALERPTLAGRARAVPDLDRRAVGRARPTNVEAH